MNTMATSSTIIPEQTQAPSRVVADDQRVEMLGVGWEDYLAMLAIQVERSRPQIVYLDGDLLLLSPSPHHERLVNRLGHLVREVAISLSIPCEPTRETTFRREKDEAGIQPDDGFYLANLGPIVAKKDKENIDLCFDPPPDLVIEVVHTHSATHAVECLRRFGVPEVWVAADKGLTILVLQVDGQYSVSEASLAFPFLSTGEISGWASRPGGFSQWGAELRQWVQEELVPRVRGQGG